MELQLLFKSLCRTLRDKWQPIDEAAEAPAFKTFYKCIVSCTELNGKSKHEGEERLGEVVKGAQMEMR